MVVQGQDTELSPQACRLLTALLGSTWKQVKGKPAIHNLHSAP